MVSGARKLTSDPRSLVTISTPDGRVVGQNRAAAQAMGRCHGHTCWRTMEGLEGAERLPCADGCTARLTRGAKEISEEVTVRGRRYALECVPINGKVVSVMSPMETPQAEPTIEGPGLTPREVEVVRLLAEGRTTAEIASDLGLGGGTVRSHVERARNKLEAPTRAALVARAIRGGYL